MNRVLVILTIALFLAAPSGPSFAQRIYGGPSIPGLSKDTESKSLSLAIEMILLYKLLGQPSMVASDGGVMVLFGNKISRYDKDLNLVKEVTLSLDIKGMQDLVSKVAHGYSDEVMNTMGAATGNLSKAGGSASESLARATLRSISTAAESYATANNGSYPKSIYDLTTANPPYINTEYCNKELSGYKYTCEFTSTSYKVTAVPGKGSEGLSSFTITTGGVIQP